MSITVRNKSELVQLKVKNVERYFNENVLLEDIIGSVVRSEVEQFFNQSYDKKKVNVVTSKEEVAQK